MRRVFALCAAALVGCTSAAYAETISFSLQATDDSRWLEHSPSDAFAQVDGGPFYPGGLLADGFYLISELPGFVPVGGGAIVFPNGPDFTDVGTVTVDASGLSGVGTELAPVTGLDVDFSRYISDNDAIVSQPYTTAISNLVGNAQYVDGQLDALDFGCDIAFGYDFSGFGGGIFDFNGTFSVDGDTWDLSVDQRYDLAIDLHYEWDFEGSVTSIVSLPEASPAVSSVFALATLVRLRRARGSR